MGIVKRVLKRKVCEERLIEDKEKFYLKKIIMCGERTLVQQEKRGTVVYESITGKPEE